MAQHVIYKASPKALKKNKFHPDHRIVLLGDDSAMLYQDNHLIQSDLRYKRKDSHLTETDEPLPVSLFATRNEINHIKDNKIQLPVAILCAD